MARENDFLVVPANALLTLLAVPRANVNAVPEVGIALPSANPYPGPEVLVVVGPSPIHRHDPQPQCGSFTGISSGWIT